MLAEVFRSEVSHSYLPLSGVENDVDNSPLDGDHLGMNIWMLFFQLCCKFKKFLLSKIIVLLRRGKGGDGGGAAVLDKS